MKLPFPEIIFILKLNSYFRRILDITLSFRRKLTVKLSLQKKT